MHIISCFRMPGSQITDIEGWARAVEFAGLQAYHILSEVNDWVKELEIMRAVHDPLLNIKRGLTALCYHEFAQYDAGKDCYKRTGELFRKWYQTYGTTFASSLNKQPSVRNGEKTMGITWLHLSDWHQKGEEFDRKVVRDALLKDIEKRADISPDLSTIDFVVFSGDLANSGKTEEYEAAREQLFDPVLRIAGVPHDRLFIVPGNHDLDRSKFYRLPAALLNPLDSDNEVQKWLTNSSDRELLLDPFQAFSDFVRTYTGQNFPDYANIRIWPISGKQIALLGLNSAWMCGRNKDVSGKHNDKGFTLIGEPQIHDALEQISKADIKIVVLHHPFGWLAEFDNNRVESRLMSKCDFILRGHQHKPDVQVTDRMSGKCVIIPAGVCYGKRAPNDPRYTSAYNFVHLDTDAGHGNVFLRCWSDPRHEWIKDNNSSPEGEFQFSFA